MWRVSLKTVYLNIKNGKYRCLWSQEVVFVSICFTKFIEYILSWLLSQVLLHDYFLRCLIVIAYLFCPSIPKGMLGIISTTGMRALGWKRAGIPRRGSACRGCRPSNSQTKQRKRANLLVAWAWKTPRPRPLILKDRQCPALAVVFQEWILVTSIHGHHGSNQICVLMLW